MRRWLPLSIAAEQVGVDRVTLMRAADRGELRVHREPYQWGSGVRYRWRVTPQALSEWQERYGPGKGQGSLLPPGWTDGWVELSEAARLSGRPVKALRQASDSGRLPTRRVQRGKATRRVVRLSDLALYMRRRVRGPQHGYPRTFQETDRPVILFDLPEEAAA